MNFRKKKTKAGERWEAVEDIGVNPTTGKRKQVTRLGKTRKEAKERLEKYLRSIEEYGVDEKQSLRITFEEVAAEWIKVYESTGRKKSSVYIRTKEIRLLNKHMAKKPIGAITHMFYQNVINELATDLARTTVQGVNNCAGMIFKFAKRNKLMKELPNEDVVIPKKRKSVDEIKKDNIAEKYLEHVELEDFFEKLNIHGLELDKERFYLLAFTGMRSGELCALQKQDLDFENNTIDINKTIYNNTNNMKAYELTPPKTVGSIRVIDVDQPIMDMLKKLVRKNDEHKMEYRTLIDDFHDKDFLFQRKNGYPYSPAYLLKRMNRIVERTKIEKKATPHIFRHTHISMMAEAKVDLATIMKRVGHEDVDTTMKIYTHVTDKMKKDASEKMSNLYGNILENITL
ncbi:tyrosine recombinase XerC [Paraliobacillus ryukyuensis]|uniref:Site-specific recombinase XerD n=1 Tax=Paraliobacillus ryukyuensis TaxID=200904 RepID=A0A366DQ08_9BACI|nr:site-specific integrase [Paraliobacillus ryukyuensis]RBO91288.1 site-specific recombinase XerD [Paraliobacillus ryukyuensis]